VVLGGGGGATRSGIKNKLRLYEIGDDRSITQKAEFELEKGEDAPMSMAAHCESASIVCGINSTEEELKKGSNENCRVYTVGESSISPLSTKGTLPEGDLEDYQKVTALSQDGSILAVAGAHDLSLLSFPSLAPAAPPLKTEKEIYDVALTPSSLIIATTHQLLVYALPDSSASEKDGQSVPSPREPLVLRKTVEVPAVVGAGGTFRSIRVRPDGKVAYTLINTVPPRTKSRKSATRQGYIVNWNAESWTVDKSRKVGDKGLTCFDISPDGRFLGFGSSDLSIGMVDALTLAPCASILKAHEFPPTVLKFNPTSTLLISGSADNSIRVITIPAATAASGTFSITLIALLIIILAILVQMYLRSAGAI